MEKIIYKPIIKDFLGEGVRVVQVGEENGRQEIIEKELDCRFIRVSDKENDNYNIGLVIKGIFNL